MAQYTMEYVYIFKKNNKKITFEYEGDTKSLLKTIRRNVIISGQKEHRPEIKYISKDKKIVLDFRNTEAIERAIEETFSK